MEKTNYVDTLIGTIGDAKSNGSHGGGKTHPGACTPFGMVQLSPDTVTGADEGTGYNYLHNTIEGFSVNHVSGMGCYGDFGNLQMMPVAGDTDLRSGSNAEVPFLKGTKGWKSSFSHENELARAGYYKVILDTYGITAEATATPHCGVLRFRYPERADKRVIFNFSRRIAGHVDEEHVNIINDKHIEGYLVCTGKGGGFGRGSFNITYNLYFVISLSQPMKAHRFFENETFLQESKTACSGEDVGLLATFDDTEVVIKCGISYTSLEGAKESLLAECADFDFDTIRQNADKLWEDAFQCVTVSGENETNLTLFHTCLYHAFLDPRILSDRDGAFRTPDGHIHKKHHTQRTVFSGWDVFRSEVPLLTLIAPEAAKDLASSLYTMAEYNNCAYPRFDMLGTDARGCMLGDAGLLTVGDAALKGIKGFDEEKAYQIAYASSKSQTTLFEKHFEPVRPTEKSYTEHAYVVYDKPNPNSPYDNNSLSKTLEYLLSDFVMYQWAKRLGKTEDAAHFLARVKRYGENYNPTLGFMAPRNEQGAFVPVKDKYAETGCIESNIYQQSFFVPYDVLGLSKVFGEERFLTLLEELFDKADLSALWNTNYNHSNEPCHNLTHYFNILGQSHRTQYWTRRVQSEAYRLGAYGFCGNEDAGQLSAWYVLSALGFAQVCIGHDAFLVNTPLFRHITIALDNNYHSCAVSKTLIITCDQDPLEFPYISKLYLNGNELQRSYVTFSELTAGGTLSFVLSKEPDTSFGNQQIPSFF